MSVLGGERVARATGAEVLAEGAAEPFERVVIDSRSGGPSLATPS